ncbi:MAG TPA: type VII secretion target [Candidatus Dormibacteraeota bacterium]|jgi:hypothetical protein|nr:type VII secretion target [Candidatus Dormibacteraeota bacterium]
MATGPDYTVDTAALRAMAAWLDSQTTRVSATIGHFTGPARLVDRAFGVMGPSDELQRQYDEAVNSALKGLGDLRSAYPDAAAKFRTAADNYDAAERAGGGKG